MIIAYDSNDNKFCGITRYRDELAKFIPQLQNNIDIVQLNYKKYFNRKLLNEFYNIIDTRVSLSRKLSSFNASLFHCTKNFTVPYKTKVKVITTIHDIIPLSLKNYYAHSIFHKFWYKNNYTHSIKNSDIIITISKFTQHELLKLYPECKDKLRMIYLGCDNQYGNNIDYHDSAKIVNSLGIYSPYILTMGGAEPRKNMQNFINAFISNKPKDHKLVVIGDNWRNLSLTNNNDDDIKILNKIDESSLISLYKMASAFVFPSFYEGFGLPVLEAMACNIPVVAHDGSCIPEITGYEAALLVDMHNMDCCIKMVHKILKEKNLSDELKIAGKDRVKLFSWSKTASLTLDVYNNVLID